MCSTPSIMDDKPFIGGDSPSIADIRLAATLEFLSAIDYELPSWAEDILTAMEERSARPIRSRRPTCAATSSM